MNNPYVQQIKSSQVNRIRQVPLYAIWLWCQWKKVYNPLNRTYREDIRGSHLKKRLMMVASIEHGFGQRLIFLLDNHHLSSLTYWPWYKHLNQSKKPFNPSFSILDNEQTLQTYGNGFSGQHKVAIQTHHHPEKCCIISWWLKYAAPCGPSARNHMYCLFVALNRH